MGTWWRGLVGNPHPGSPIKAGPHTITVADPLPDDATTRRRAVIDRYILTVDDQGSATLVVPPGQRVTVLTTAG